MQDFKKIKKYHSFLRFKKEFTKHGLNTAKSYEIVLHWLKSKLSRNHFLILSGILVGITAGMAGVVLKSLVAYIHHFITGEIHFEYQILFYIIFPFMGIVLTTLLVIVFFKGQDRKGIPAILYEIAQNSSLVSKVKMYSQIIQSAVTVGLGGSAGLESPIAVTGSAIGSNYAQRYNLAYKDRTLLLAAGATAGIASAFNAPIAGIMFAFEILLTGVVFTDFIPLVVAAVCGSLLSRIILQEDILFHFNARSAFNYHNVPLYLLLGIACGLYARYFVLVAHFIEKFFKGLNISRIRKAMLGGALLSLLCLLLPPLFGEGYQTIKDITNGQAEKIISNSFFRNFDEGDTSLLFFLGVTCLAKAFATSITIQSGGNGGNFAPSLFAGGTLGYFFATLCKVLGFHDVPVVNMVIVGMAGVMSGVLYAPLTAIFLIAESSAGYDLFIPLMIVAVISYLMALTFSPVSPDLQELTEKGKIFTREHDKNLLSLLNTTDMVESDQQTITIDSSFEDLLKLIKTGKKNLVAVLGEEKILQGIITLDDLRPYMFSPEPGLSIRKLTKPPVSVIYISDGVNNVIKKFDESNSWTLPVVGSGGEFIGFLSKSTILNQYRQLLREHSN